MLGAWAGEEVKPNAGTEGHISGFFKPLPIWVGGKKSDSGDHDLSTPPSLTGEVPGTNTPAVGWESRMREESTTRGPEPAAEEMRVGGRTVPAEGRKKNNQKIKKYKKI